MPTENINENIVNEAPKKKWEDYTLAEKKESYLKYVVKEIADSIKGNYAPFTKPVKEFERAYNPSNGKPYTTLNSLMLDLKQKKENYEKNQWISLNDATFLGATKEERDAIIANKDIPKVQVHFIRTQKIVPVYKLDENGNKIPILDENNKEVKNDKGETRYEYILEPQKDKNGKLIINLNTNQPYMKIKTETISVEPTLETRFLYNIDEFKTINKNRLKPIDKDQKYRNFIRHEKTFDKTKSPLIFEDIEKIIYPHTATQIKEYLQAQNENKEYIPTKGFNDIEKTQLQQAVEKGVDDALKKIAENKPLIPETAKEAPVKETPVKEAPVKEAPKVEKQAKAQPVKPKVKEEKVVEQSRGR